MSLVLARSLGHEAFGQYAIIINTLLTAAAVAQLGTSATTTKYLAEFRTSQKKRAGRILGLCILLSGVAGGILSLLLVAGSWQVAAKMLKAPDLTLSLIIASGILLFVALIGVRAAALAGLENYRGIAQAGMIGSVASVTLAGAGAFIYGLNAALIGLLLASALQWIVLQKQLRTELQKQSIELTYSGLETEKPILMRFALPAALSGMFSMPAFWLANTLLVRQDHGFSAMALFSAAATTKVLMLFFPNIINGVGTSLLNNQRGLGSPHDATRIFWTNLATVVGVAAVGGAVVWVLTNPLLSLFGPYFVAGSGVLHILLIAGMLEATTSAVYQLIQAEEKMIFSVFCITIPRDLTVLALAMVLVPSEKAFGLAWAYTGGWLLALVMTIVGAVSAGRKYAVREVRAS